MPLLSIKSIHQSPELLRQCGGKGRSLVKLDKLGYKVPTFLIFPSNEVAHYLQPLNTKIQVLLASLTTADHKNIIQTAQKIAEMILSLSMTSEYKHSITMRCQHTFGSQYHVSVRSSALAEDGQHHSFAGQLDSFLYVTPTTLIDSIKSCIASLYSARAIKYRLNNNLNISDGMAVVIQEMVSATKSGVLFTMNTAGNMNESAIVAAYGVGEGIVSDRSDSDMFYVERGTQRVVSVVHKKSVRLDANPNGHRGTTENNVVAELQEQPVLSEAEAIHIAELGLHLEQHLGCAQDIEFAFNANKELLLLQARPITAIPIGELKILDNSNIIESYPGITLPLSIDFARQAYQGVFLAAAKAFKLPRTFIKNHEKQFAELLIRVNGRVYYQLQNARRIMEAVLVSRRSQQGWRSFIGLEGIEWPLVTPSFSRRVKSFFILIHLVFTHQRTMKRLFTVFQDKYTEIQTFIDQQESKSSADIYQFYQDTCDILFKEWAPTIINDYFAMKAHDLYKARLTALGLDTHDNLANDLLCGIEGMESEQPIILLLGMKELILQSPYLQHIFEKKPKEIWYTLSDNATNKTLEPASLQAKTELMVLWDNYLEKFSDRTLEELKLETPTLKMQPWILAGMLKNQLANTSTLKSFKMRQQRILGHAEAIIKQRLKNATWQKWVFNFFLGKARQAIKDRENMRINRARIYGAVKSLFLELGQRMHQDQLLDKAEDVFYLRLHDLQAYSIEDKKHTKKSQVIAEKQALEQYRNMEMPDRLIYRGEAPNLSYYNTMPTPLANGQLKGIGVSKGNVTAPARVLQSPSMDLKINGEILVTRMTDPGWVFLMSQAAGIISEKGSLLSHTAIIGREFGIPTVVGVNHATQLVHTGDQLALNGDLGEITLLASANGTTTNNTCEQATIVPEETAPSL
ncbi:hypothetical protein AB835_06740 [Candidatus Endobugula sertula]|uniref:Phosphoenolpyruvate synthase n=1 Tax=Candidatus Endobugula sertula TaxID=62101 RepID=A0A1D2QQG9_9GAMM|nr:hypothetical protein AB835_06740 [Candidatus Endobugula sertula]